MTIGGKADRREDRHDVGADEMDDEVLVDPVDPAGVLLVDALDDARRDGPDRVGDCAFQPVLGESLENEV